MNVIENRCLRCGGLLAFIAKAGRIRRYGGMCLEIPSNIELPECKKCGALNLRKSDTERLDKIFRAKYAS